jgi:four helix bundle protein
MRGTRKDYANFVNIARGSLAELETFLLLAERVQYYQRGKRVPQCGWQMKSGEC